MRLSMHEDQAASCRHTVEMLRDALDYQGLDVPVSYESRKIVLRLDIIEADALTTTLRGHDNRSKEE